MRPSSIFGRAGRGGEARRALACGVVDEPSECVLQFGDETEDTALNAPPRKQGEEGTPLKTGISMRFS
jgi:hypothetical protein